MLSKKVFVAHLVVFIVLLSKGWFIWILPMNCAEPVPTHLNCERNERLWKHSELVSWQDSLNYSNQLNVRQMNRSKSDPHQFREPWIGYRQNAKVFSVYSAGWLTNFVVSSGQAVSRMSGAVGRCQLATGNWALGTGHWATPYCRLSTFRMVVLGVLWATPRRHIHQNSL